MVLLWELLFPLIALLGVGFFIYSFRKGVKEGIYQKSIFRRKRK